VTGMFDTFPAGCGSGSGSGGGGDMRTIAESRARRMLCVMVIHTDSAMPGPIICVGSSTRRRQHTRGQMQGSLSAQKGFVPKPCRTGTAFRVVGPQLLTLTTA